MQVIPKRSLVLVVEDEDSLRILVQFYLIHQGFQVVGAKNGQGALIACRGQAVDLALVDVWLPGQTGLAMLVALGEARPGCWI